MHETKTGLQALLDLKFDIPQFKPFWDWVRQTFSGDYRSEIDRYLADSVDHADVERRIMHLTRRGLI